MLPLSVGNNFNELEEHAVYSNKDLLGLITHKNKHNIHLKQDYRNLVSGFLSSMISRTIVAPLDRLKILYQVNYVGTNKPPNIIKGLIGIYKSEGFRGYFKGNGINIVKGSPEIGIKLYFFELIKWNLQCRYGESLSLTSIFLAGAISGVIATVTIFPLEVLKIRIAAAEIGTYNNVIDAVVKIYKEPRGLFNFYSGIEAGICTVIPNAGLNLTIYEILKIFFSGKKTSDNASSLSSGILMFIGGLSALVSSTILYPFQIIQARMIMHNLKPNELKLNRPEKSRIPMIYKYKFITSFYTTYKVDGLMGFYKGYAPGIGKIVAGNALGFLVYEKSRNWLGVNKKM
jgi:solute carrier family 25 (mitochondrial phosphate transporter), member 23/24/25/41